MPYILSPQIKVNQKGLWQEGMSYSKESIYKIDGQSLPPVNYDAHILKPHSLTHAEASLHTTADGKNLDSYFMQLNYFYGKCFVIKLQDKKYELIDKEKNIYKRVIQKQELEDHLKQIKNPDQFSKILISTEDTPYNTDGYHKENYVLTLSQEAADYLVSFKNFNLFGTSWKSTDYQPGSKERPIHKTIFKKAIIFELLYLKDVPQGEYFFVGFPLRLEAASESPVTPVLFNYDEI